VSKLIYLPVMLNILSR